MTILELIQQSWNDFLNFLSTVIIPDWQAVIAMLPLLILIGVVGPILTIILLVWMGYAVTAPRTKVKWDEGVIRTAPLDALGEPVFPAGEPYCPNDGLIYPFGTLRCDRDKTPLSIRCPKCDTVREAAIAACGNCGLILSMEPRALIVATDRPPPGGAAAA